MTNGEKIKELFPYFDVEDKTEYFGRLRNLDDRFIKANIDFWNAEYKEPKCQWIKYDYRTVCPKEHDINNPYWRIPENRMDALKYCPYCGKEIEVK